MKAICFILDSLNRHFLNAYGNPIAETPHLDWFAERAHVFDKHFSGSLPTMPTRREIWTGNYEFQWRPWGALEPWDRELPLTLREHDILTMLITDSYHLFERGSSNYHFGFEGWEFFRGFENDPWVTEPTAMPPHRGNMNPRYPRNMRRMQKEEDLPPAKTLRCVERWLQKNYMHEQFFLMVDEFAPHEPFNVPDYLVRKYDPDYRGPICFWPKYGRNVHTEEDIRHLRAQYAAHIELIDKYLGRVFETMSDLDLWKDTAVVIMTDHGHYLGEHGFTGKPGCPPYNTLAHIPFMVYLPGTGGGRRVGALTANVDVFPTILELFGLPPEAPVDGRSVLPLVRCEADRVRGWTLYGHFGRFTSITDGKMTYLRAPQNLDAALYVYSLRWEFGFVKRGLLPPDAELEFGPFMKRVGMPVGRFLRGSAREAMAPIADVFNHLYDLEKDPAQDRNLAGGPEEKTYADLMQQAMREVDAPPEQFERMGLT